MIVFPLFHFPLFQAELEELVKREHALIDSKEGTNKGQQMNQGSSASEKDVENTATDKSKK